MSEKRFAFHNGDFYDGVCEVSSAYTSQTCHICGSINSELACDDREWICTNCQSVHDRDINAAINILNRWDNGDLPFDR